MVFDRDILTASYGEMLEGLDAWAEDTSDECNTCDCGVAKVETGQASAVGTYYLL